MTMATRRQSRTSYKSFNGLRNDVGPERFGTGDLVAANNVDIDKTGRIARRDGYTRKVAGAAHSLWAQGGTALFVAGTNLMRLSTDYSATVLRAVSGARASFSQVGERVYFSDGTNTGVYENSAVRSWGMAAPALPVATLVGGSLTPGTYQFTITKSRADGQESGAALAGVVEVAEGQGLQLDWLSADNTDATAWNIYLTTPNGDTLYLAMSQPTALKTYTVAASDVLALALPLTTQFMVPAPAGQLVSYYRGHMFVAVGSVLYMSEPFAYEMFDLRNYIEFDAPITMIAPIEDRAGAVAGVFIGTEKSTGVLTGSGPADFQYVAKVDYGVVLGALDYVDGTLLGEGATNAKQLPMWLSAQGICVGMPMMEVENQTRGRYDLTANGTGAATFMPPANKFVAVFSDGVVVMRTETNAVTTYSNFPFNSFARFNGAHLGATSEGLFELVGETDNGMPIAAEVRTGVNDFGSGFIKQMDRLYVGYRSDADMTLSVTTDETETAPSALPALNADGIHGTRVKVGKGMRGRYWQFTLRNLLGARFTIDEIDTAPLDCQRRLRA